MFSFTSDHINQVLSIINKPFTILDIDEKDKTITVKEMYSTNKYSIYYLNLSHMIKTIPGLNQIKIVDTDPYCYGVYDIYHPSYENGNAILYNNISFIKFLSGPYLIQFFPGEECDGSLILPWETVLTDKRYMTRFLWLLNVYGYDNVFAFLTQEELQQLRLHVPSLSAYIDTFLEYTIG